MVAHAAPLESRDPVRATALKRKIHDRLRDVTRHLQALEAAMASFGDDFDRATFQVAFDSRNPEELNRVKAVERGVDQLYNYTAELAAFGAELADRRGRHDETNARRDLDTLAELRVVSRERLRRIQRLRELRRMLVPEYTTATAAQVHEAANIIVAELPPFYRAYVKWVQAGFAVPTA